VKPAYAFPVLMSLGAAILMLTWLALSLHVPGSIWVGTLPRKDAVVALMLGSAGLYFGAVWIVTHHGLPARAWLAVLAVAAILRLSLLAAPPFMSTDIYRYVWDGRVQHAGINPYAYIAADPHLEFLRGTPVYSRMNRVDYAHTIYPPAAQMLFAGVAAISQTVIAMKIAMVILECCGIAAMLAMLNAAGMPLGRILIYAWNPLAAWAVAGDGHIDGVAIGLLSLAMLAATRRREGIAGVLLGAAALTKFLPIAVAPALWRRWGWKMPVATCVTIACLYACYISVGWQVLGFLPTYTTEEGLAQGSGFWLLALIGRIATLPHFVTMLYLAASAAAFAGLAIMIAFQWRHEAVGREIQIARGMALLAACLVAAFSPHYPWYYAWLALPCCLWCTPAVLWLSAAPLLLYSDPWHDEILLPTAVFVPAIGIAAWSLLQARQAHAA
jgi:alpha-1,6-mannosyltransferase